MQRAKSPILADYPAMLLNFRHNNHGWQIEAQSERCNLFFLPFSEQKSANYACRQPSSLIQTGAQHAPTPGLLFFAIYQQCLSEASPDDMASRH